MPCRKPLEAVQYEKGGKLKFKHWTHRRPEYLSDAYSYLEVPCGQCIGCRLEQSRVWGMRIAHEANYLWEEFDLPSSFITLTYEEKHLPTYGTLVKDHLQKFFKRFRRRIEPNQIKYYAAGEYGSRCPKHELDNCPMCGPIQRPHYHAIVLGFGFPDRQHVGDREGLPIYESNFLSQLWPFGFHEIGSCSFESAAYVARYVMKKQTGPNAEYEGHYMRHQWQTDQFYEVEPEFALMSRRPGIGKEWYEKYKSDIYPRDEVTIPGRGVVGIPPKIYDAYYSRENPSSMEQIKQKRRDEFAKSLVEGPSLQSRALVQDAKINLLKRSM